MQTRTQPHTVLGLPRAPSPARPGQEASGGRAGEPRAKIGVAVIGTGNMGQRHLDLLRHLEGVEAVAVPKRRDRVRELSEQGWRSAASIEEAVRLGATACIITTDTGEHARDAIEALEHGLDILVEKPLAPNARQATRVCRRAAELKRRVFVACVLRFSTSLQAFRDHLSEIGLLHAVQIECQSYLPDWRPHRPYVQTYSARAGEGGVLLDLIHEIDYAGWLFGWPTAVHARLRNLGRLGIAADEIAHVSWELPDGGIVSITLDYLSRTPSRRMKACGAQGTVEWDGMAQTVTLKRPGCPDRVTSCAQTKEELFGAQTRAFLAACAGNAPPALATCEEGWRAVSVCDAARRASARRRETRVPSR